MADQRFDIVVASKNNHKNVSRNVLFAFRLSNFRLRLLCGRALLTLYREKRQCYGQQTSTYLADPHDVIVRSACGKAEIAIVSRAESVNFFVNFFVFAHEHEVSVVIKCAHNRF